MLKTVIASLTSLLVAACDATGGAARPRPEFPTMKPSVTYLHLLRHTPFFTALDRQQLRWTIDHSHEWEAEPDTVIAEAGDDATPADDAIWILLDGGWRVDVHGRQYPAGHADPGKWFSATVASGPYRLVTTEHSYVMRIARADMDDMLARGFGFTSHLQTGEAYYANLFPADTH